MELGFCPEVMIWGRAAHGRRLGGDPTPYLSQELDP